MVKATRQGLCCPWCGRVVARQQKGLGEWVEAEGMKIRIEQRGGESTVAAWQDEIEHAIDNVKRTKWDKWMRREWHKAAARERWTEGRKAEWEDWRKRQRRDDTPQPLRPPAAEPKVWVRGHVPREFLDWVERHWSHDGETRVMLGQCCFEVWER